MTRQTTWAVVPVKDLNRAKRRLAGTLDPRARRALSMAMLADVLDALAAAPGLAGVAVISRDARVADLARTRTLRYLPDPDAGLNGAVRHAARVLSSEGCTTLLVLPADVPLVSARDVASILDAQGAGPGLTVVPDRKGIGTNALACAPPDAIPPRFGQDSFARHLAAARRAGIEAKVVRLPRLGLDLDTAEDLRTFTDQPGATRSHALLRARRTAPVLAAGGSR